MVAFLAHKRNTETEALAAEAKALAAAAEEARSALVILVEQSLVQLVRKFGKPFLL